MKKIISLLCLSISVVNIFAQIKQQPALGHRSANILTINNFQFKDLNRNNKLDKYEDWRLPYSAI